MSGWQAVVVLEAGSRRRTVMAPLRLRAAALYGLLGAPAPAEASYQALSIKHIQNDTVTGTLRLPRPDLLMCKSLMLCLFVPLTPYKLWGNYGFI